MIGPSRLRDSRTLVRKGNVERHLSVGLFLFIVYSISDEQVTQLYLVDLIQTSENKRFDLVSQDTRFLPELIIIF